MAASPGSSPFDLVLGVVGSDHAVGPVEDLAPVLLGHAQQLGDDEEREFGRDLLDEVGGAALAHRIDDAVGVSDDLRFQVAHDFRGEAFVDQPAVAGVHGRVHVQHHHLLLDQLLVVHVGEEGRALGRGEVLPVPVDGDAVVVAGHGPEATPGGVRLRGASRRGPRWRSWRNHSWGTPATKLRPSIRSISSRPMVVVTLSALPPFGRMGSGWSGHRPLGDNY